MCLGLLGMLNLVNTFGHVCFCDFSSLQSFSIFALGCSVCKLPSLWKEIKLYPYRWHCFEVIKLEYSLRLKIKCNDWLLLFKIAFWISKLLSSNWLNAQRIHILWQFCAWYPGEWQITQGTTFDLGTSSSIWFYFTSTHAVFLFSAPSAPGVFQRTLSSCPSQLASACLVEVYRL